MRRRLPWTPSIVALCLAALVPVSGQRSGNPRRNVLIFVADGLRHGSVNAEDTPSLWAVRREGVHFENSHSVFPTFTTANASAIATGHGLGDTGDYSNTIWPGFATFDSGNFGLLPVTPVPFLEDDRVLADLDGHFGGNYLGSDTFLETARAHGYRTATIGKIGPTAIQDAAALAPVDKGFPRAMPGLIIDDSTGSDAGLPWPPDLSAEMLKAGIPSAAPTRSNGYGPTSPFNNGYTGDRSHPGTIAVNLVQQDWFSDVAVRVLLPWLARDAATPFALIYWSREPDGTQHNHGDSRGALEPGINGETSRRALQLADRDLGRLLAWLDAHPAVKANTDVIVTSDHGFATISRSKIDRASRTSSESARHDYLGDAGGIDTLKGTLPYGFLALDLAYDLQLSAFDPDQRPTGSRLYKPLRIGSSASPVVVDTWEHPVRGNALLGRSVLDSSGSDARVIVAANGGSDLIYIPDGSAETLQHVVDRLLTYDYVGGVFVDDKYGKVPGTLPLSAINLVGASRLPRPSVVVAFKVFYMNAANLQTAVQIADTVLQEGQGMHGGFGREQTFNNMAMMGPDFKKGFVDAAPAGNGDITPTLNHVLGFDPPKGSLVGRVLLEALTGGPPSSAPPLRYLRSAAANGKQTLLVFQEHDGVRYLDMSCFVVPAASDATACR